LTKYNHVLDDFFLKEFKISLQYADKYFIKLSEDKWFSPGGNNGPHFAIESPVRNTCHWIVALLIGYKLFNDDEFLLKAKYLGRWLLDDNNFYRQECYVMRQTKGTDWVNGVIGPSWVLEALSRLGSYAKDNQATDRAETIVGTLKYNEEEGGWCRYDPFTKKYTVDYTYDHQAWLAAALYDCGEVQTVGSFIDSLHAGNYDVDSSGKIFHLLKTSSFKGRILAYRYKKNFKLVEDVEVGYHLYCLYPLAKLASVYSGHEFFNSSKMQLSLDYCSYDNILKMEHSRYGFAYNAPGLELPMVYGVFGDRMPISKDEVIAIYDKQMELTGDMGSRLQVKNNPDPMTMAARIYELAMFLEMLIEK